jgi:hypothetical protein
MGAIEPTGVCKEALGPTPPVLADARDLEKAAAIPSSPSPPPEQLDRQEPAVSSSPPVLAGERDPEQAAAIPSSPSLAPEQLRPCDARHGRQHGCASGQMKKISAGRFHRLFDHLVGAGE